MKFEALSREYATLWDGMQITRLEKSIAETADKIIVQRVRYENVQALTNVPWFVIGIIHAMETGLKFDRHLHNGDPLTAPTKLVPKARPPGKGPFSFEASCCDALGMKNYGDIKAWTVERIAWALENYNGWGYRKYHPETRTPYLWSGTNHYTAGKYVADGKWSATAVSTQSGGMALLKVIADKCPDVVLASHYGADASDPEQHTPASNSKTDAPPMLTPREKVIAGSAPPVLFGFFAFLDPAIIAATLTAWKAAGVAVADIATWAIGQGKIGIAAALGLVSFGAMRWFTGKRDAP